MRESTTTTTTTIIAYHHYPLHYVLHQCLLFCYVWWLCMASNINVQHNGGLLPDIILLTQGYYHRGTRLNTMQWLCLYSLCNTWLLLPCLMMYCNVSVLFVLFVWCPYMAINGSVQYNGGLLPGIIMSTQYYYHRGTRLNAMKRFCICSLRF